MKHIGNKKDIRELTEGATNRQIEEMLEFGQKQFKGFRYNAKKSK